MQGEPAGAGRIRQLLPTACVWASVQAYVKQCLLSSSSSRHVRLSAPNRLRRLKAGPAGASSSSSSSGCDLLLRVAACTRWDVHVRLQPPCAAVDLKVRDLAQHGCVMRSVPAAAPCCSRNALQPHRFTAQCHALATKKSCNSSASSARSTSVCRVATVLQESVDLDASRRVISWQ
jgi:uncharacterized Zn-finger protein